MPLDNLVSLEEAVISALKGTSKTFTDIDRDCRVPASSMRYYVLNGKISNKDNLFKLANYFQIKYAITN